MTNPLAQDFEDTMSHNPAKCNACGRLSIRRLIPNDDCRFCRGLSVDSSDQIAELTRKLAEAESHIKELKFRLSDAETGMKTNADIVRMRDTELRTVGKKLGEAEREIERMKDYDALVNIIRGSLGSHKGSGLAEHLTDAVAIFLDPPRPAPANDGKCPTCGEQTDDLDGHSRRHCNEAVADVGAAFAEPNDGNAAEKIMDTIHNYFSQQVGDDMSKDDQKLIDDVHRILVATCGLPVGHEGKCV